MSSFQIQETLSKRSLALLGVGVVHAGIFWALLNGFTPKMLLEAVLPMTVVPVPPKEKPVDPLPTLEPVQDDAFSNPKIEPPILDFVVPKTDASAGLTIPEPQQIVEPERPQIEPVALPVRNPAQPILSSMRVSESDYPMAAIRLNQEGTTKITIQINVLGRVEQCSVRESSGSEHLDKRSCELALRRFRFEPGTLDGVAVPTTETRSIRWELRF